MYPSRVRGCGVEALAFGDRAAARNGIRSRPPGQQPCLAMRRLHYVLHLVPVEHEMKSKQGWRTAAFRSERQAVAVALVP